MSSQAPSQAFYVSGILPWIALECHKNMTYLQTIPLATYCLADEHPILVYVGLFLFILSFLDREANFFYVSMILDILLLKSLT